MLAPRSRAGAEQRIVSRPLHQHVVAGFEQRGEGLEVGAGGAVCRVDLLGGHAVAAAMASTSG